jgi:mRNA interferase RelE/StbE
MVSQEIHLDFSLSTTSVLVINRLAEEPEKQGKAILEELAGFRSIRAVARHYPIIYTVKNEEIIVVVVAVGIRRDGARDDIYNLTKKLLRLGLLNDYEGPVAESLT